MAGIALRLTKDEFVFFVHRSMFLELHVGDLFEAEGDLFFQFARKVDVGAAKTGSALDEDSADFGSNGFDLNIDGGVIDFGDKGFVDAVFVDDGAVEADHFKGGEVEIFDGALIAAFDGVFHPR